MNEDIFKSATSQLKGNIWLDALFGIEKENIRVDEAGNLSQTPHPKVFGNKRKHPYITTDFSESQIEMITPPLPDIKQTLGFLETLHDVISLELTNEYLWPQSIPPVLPEDKQIPIAQYDEDGKEAQQYRELLAQKYGPKNQLARKNAKCHSNQMEQDQFIAENAMQRKEQTRMASAAASTTATVRFGSILEKKTSSA